MAKTNQGTLCGVLEADPRFNTAGTYASVVMRVIKGIRNAGDGKRQVFITYPVIISRDEEIIKKMKDMNKGDLVYIKGVIVTRRVIKPSLCKNCKAENRTEGLITYFEPIYIEKLKHLSNESEIEAALLEHQEISNEIRIVGDICCDLSVVEDKNAKANSVRYQIAVPRTYRLKNSTEDEKTDFPRVRSYGKNAAEDLKRIHKGSQVLIDGYIQGLNFQRECECASCKAKYTWDDRFMEIVPYETEYLRNYVTDEELGVTVIKE